MHVYDGLLFEPITDLEDNMLNLVVSVAAYRPMYQLTFAVDTTEGIKFFNEQSDNLKVINAYAAVIAKNGGAYISLEKTFVDALA